MRAVLTRRSRFAVLAGVLLWMAGAASRAHDARGPASGDAVQSLASRMSALPERWERLVKPLVPSSGRWVEEVQGTASPDEIRRATALISLLLGSPAARWNAILDETSEPASEVALWLPFYGAHQLQTRSPEQAMRLLELGLALAEHAGRRDLLLFGAGMSLQVLSLRLPSDALGRIGSTWTKTLSIKGDRMSVSELFDGGPSTLFEAFPVSVSAGV